MTRWKLRKTVFRFFKLVLISKKHIAPDWLNRIKHNVEDFLYDIRYTFTDFCSTIHDGFRVPWHLHKNDPYILYQLNTFLCTINRSILLNPICNTYYTGNLQHYTFTKNCRSIYDGARHSHLSNFYCILLVLCLEYLSLRGKIYVM